MKIFLATDHAGLELKESVKKNLLKNYTTEDCGAFNFDKNDDYPDFIAKAAKKVAGTFDAKGIFFGKSGAGECITANKIKGIRAILGFSKENVELSRLDNDANVLTLGSIFITQDQAQKLVEIFLTTPFSNKERHKRRIAKISELENSNL